MSKKARCLVLGGKGFIGSHLVDALLANGHPVRIFDRPGVMVLDGACRAHENLETVDGDFTSESDLASALQDCQLCFHLVSTTMPHSSNLDPVFDIETNLIGSVRLMKHASQLGVRKVIFLSSGGAIYGRAEQLPIPETHPTNPTCSYGITKLAIEKYLYWFHQLHGLNYVTLRFSNLYGERQRILSSQGAVAVFLGKAIAREKIEIWGDGSVIRDYIHVSDAIAAMLAAMNYEGAERTFNIGSGQGVTVNEVLAEIEALVGRKVERSYTTGRPFDVPASVLSIERAKNALHWEPQLTFKEGIGRTLAFLQKAWPVLIDTPVLKP